MSSVENHRVHMRRLPQFGAMAPGTTYLSLISRRTPYGLSFGLSLAVSQFAHGPNDARRRANLAIGGVRAVTEARHRQFRAHTVGRIRGRR